MDAGGTWERLLHTPATWIVVAVVLFVVAVVLLVAGARAGRVARKQRDAAPAGAGGTPDVEEDPVTEPSVPRAAAVPDRPGDPAATRESGGADGSAAHRLLGVLVGDPSGALAGVAALERGEEPGSAAVTLLRSGVPAPAVARLCGVDPDDLGGLVATALGILPDQARAVVAARAEPVDAPERATAPMS